MIIVCCLNGKPDAPLGFVHLDNPRFDFLTDFQGILDLFHAILADLRNVDEAVDVVLELDKRSEVCDLCDRSLHKIADLETDIDILPGIILELLGAEADALVDFIDVDDDSFDFVALLVAEVLGGV